MLKGKLTSKRRRRRIRKSHPVTDLRQLVPLDCQRKATHSPKSRTAYTPQLNCLPPAKISMTVETKVTSLTITSRRPMIYSKLQAFRQGRIMHDEQGILARFLITPNEKETGKLIIKCKTTSWVTQWVSWRWHDGCKTLTDWISVPSGVCSTRLCNEGLDLRCMLCWRASSFKAESSSLA